STTLTFWGKKVVILLVHIAGLGFGTFAILAASSLGRRISVVPQALAMDAFTQTNVNKLQNTSARVIQYAAGLQFIAFLALGRWWLALGATAADAFFRALFHVSMSFNNAGFMLYAPDTSIFYRDFFTVLITTLSIIIGGIGFPVLHDLIHKRRWARFSVYTKVVIIATVLLNIFGFLVIWAVESSNPLTIRDLSWWQQALASWVQAVSSRTAGFEAMAPENMRNASIVLIIFYMLIGGGS